MVDISTSPAAKRLRKVQVALEKMDSHSRTKKNMHLPIRDGIQEAIKELKALRYDMEDTVCYLGCFEYLLRGKMVQKMKDVRPPINNKVGCEGNQTLPQPVARSTPHTRKRLREPTVSREASPKRRRWKVAKKRTDLDEGVQKEEEKKRGVF